jgi:BASS family bile acid:Na+ symporter
MGEGRSIPLQFSKVMQVVAVVLIPVAIGMLIRARKPTVANKLDKPVRILSAVFLVLVIASAIAKQRGDLGEYFQQVGLAALAFNLASLFVGFVVPRIFRVETKQAIAIGMEIGIHNGTLAIAIATSPQLLNNSVMAIPPAIYSLIMFVTATLFGMFVARRVTTP